MSFDIHTHHQPHHPATSVRSLTVSEAEKIVSEKSTGFYSVGIHPWHISENPGSDIEQLKHFAEYKSVIFIGECGLDHKSKTPLSIQIHLFKEQIKISEQEHKPLIIHCVGHFNELLAIKKEFNPKQLWIIHGFRGKPQLASQVLRAGCALSFGEKFNEQSVQVTPVEKLYIETDESQLPIDEIYRKIAFTKDLKPEELSAGEQLLRKITG